MKYTIQNAAKSRYTTSKRGPKIGSLEIPITEQVPKMLLPRLSVNFVIKTTKLTIVTQIMWKTQVGKVSPLSMFLILKTKNKQKQQLYENSKVPAPKEK